MPSKSWQIIFGRLPVVLLLLHSVVAFLSLGDSDPLPNPGSVVVAGKARFTVFTKEMIRMEYSTAASPKFEDRQTLVIWNRKLPVPDFTWQTKGYITTIDTGSLTLTYNSSLPGFSEDNLRIRLHTPNFSNVTEWTAKLSTADGGNLYGTIRTLDLLDAEQTLNCTFWAETPVVEESEHCTMGMISKSGWAVVDDSRSPLLYDDWVHPQTAGDCVAEPEIERVPCFGFGYDPDNRNDCEKAGCCWVDNNRTVPLNLYYSPIRHDHYSDVKCDRCEDLDYSFVEQQGLLLKLSEDGTVPLIHYCTPDYGDNVLSTSPPSDEYDEVALVGYAYDPSRTPPPGSLPLKLWNNVATMDHFTTANEVEESQARGSNFSLLGTVAYILPPYSKPDGPPSCYQHSGNLDWYFLGHGMNYRQSLLDFSKIAGQIPIPRKHMLGVCWSRWGDYNQTQTMGQVESLANASFPLDTYIFDMNWHMKPHWTGWTWNSTLYPDHVALLKWLHDRGLYTAANLHDAEGVMSFELRYPEMAGANGIDPATNQTVIFHISDKTYADSLSNLVMGPLAQEGIDFWWTDWQQGMDGVLDITGLNPTFWLNHYRYTNYTLTSSRRGQILSRFGGLGNHRYPAGFAGDYMQTWDSLRFMVYFTATATNALFCWWGHEMMQHCGGPYDLELFTRVMQFGVWSPIYTNYGNDGCDDDLWSLPEPYQSATRGALINRLRTLPYRYTLAQIAYESALGPLRPMYYDYPDRADAYKARQQYMLGGDLLVSPVYTPLEKNGLSSTSIWFPPGADWVDFYNSSRVMKGGSWQAVIVPLEVVPVYAKSSSIIPLLSQKSAMQHGIASKPYSDLEFHLFPGSSKKQSSWLYDDDGLSNGYVQGEFANTTVSYLHGDDGILSVNITTSGSFSGLPTERSYNVWILSCGLPVSVQANGKDLSRDPDGPTPGSWWFSGQDLSVYLQSMSVSSAQGVTVRWH